MVDAPFVLVKPFSEVAWVPFGCSFECLSALHSGVEPFLGRLTLVAFRANSGEVGLVVCAACRPVADVVDFVCGVTAYAGVLVSFEYLLS